MTVAVTHPFVSGKADGTDTTLIQPSNWNASHAIQCAGPNVAIGRIASGTGAVTEVAIFEVLSAARTYYVAPTGVDTNDGLTSGTPFLTIQKAMDTIANNLDLAGNTVTISIAAGTYTGAVNLKSWRGGGAVTLNGAGAAATTISTTSAHCFSAAGNFVPNGTLTLQNMKLQTTTSGDCVYHNGVGWIFLGAGITFGAAASSHVSTNNPNALLKFTAAYTIAGAATTAHWFGYGGLIYAYSLTITITGTPALNIFAYARAQAYMSCQALTFSGTATGTRYSISSAGIVDTGGAATTYLPGGTAGTATAPGYYL